MSTAGASKSDDLYHCPLHGHFHLHGVDYDQIGPGCSLPTDHGRGVLVYAVEVYPPDVDPPSGDPQRYSGVADHWLIIYRTQRRLYTSEPYYAFVKPERAADIGKNRVHLAMPAEICELADLRT